MKTFSFKYDRNQGWKIPQAQRELDGTSNLLMVFGPSHFLNQPQAFADLKQQFPLSTMVGSSTCGGIFGEDIVDDTLVATLIKLEKGQIKTHCHKLDHPSQSYDIGLKLGEDLIADNLAVIFLFADGLHCNASELARGINQHINNPEIPVIGTLAGDDTRFKQTWVLSANLACEKSICAVAIYSDTLICNNAIGGGWDIFGLERVITRSKSNVVYELDDRPALDLYKEYLGEKATDLPASGLFFPLQVQLDKNSDEKYVRTVLSINEKDKSITFAGNMPEGCVAQLMKANKERLIDSAYEAAEEILQNYYESKIKDPETMINNSLTFIVNGIGRRLVLGERADEELLAIRHTLGRKNKMIGLYTYGELASSKKKNKLCSLYNQSLLLFNLSETPSSTRNQT